MALGPTSRDGSDVLRLGKDENLSALERIAVLVIISIIIVADVIGIFLPPGVEPLTVAISIASTAVLALYLWSPLLASCALAVVFALSFLPGIETQVLTTAAFG